MRITSFTIFNQLTRALHDNLRTLSHFSNRLSTGKKMIKPSDDVPEMARSMDYKVTLNEIGQFRRNIDEADAHLNYADSILSSATNILTRARELSLQGSTGSLSPEDRASMAEEAANLRNEMMSLTSSRFRNRYLFSGYKTDSEPFDPGFNYQGDSGEIKVVIDRNATIAINVRGDSIFGSGATSAMGVLDSLYNDLMGNNQTGIQAAIDGIDNSINQVASVRADIGARLNYLDDQKVNLDNRDFNFQTLLSNAEDADIAETVSEITKIELTLQSLRTAGVESISKSLLDFLR